MSQKVNPRVAMFDALQLTADLLNPANLPVVRRFLDPRSNQPIDVVGEAISFRHPVFNGSGPAYLVRVGQYIVKDRKLNSVSIVDGADFNLLYYDYRVRELELNRLADYVLKHFPELIGRQVEDCHGSKVLLDKPVDVVIYIFSHGLFKALAPEIEAMERSLDFASVDVPELVAIDVRHKWEAIKGAIMSGVPAITGDPSEM